MDDIQNDPVKMSQGYLGLYGEDCSVSFDNVKVVDSTPVPPPSPPVTPPPSPPVTPPPSPPTQTIEERVKALELDMEYVKTKLGI